MQAQSIALFLLIKGSVRQFTMASPSPFSYDLFLSPCHCVVPLGDSTCPEAEGDMGSTGYVDFFSIATYLLLTVSLSAIKKVIL